MMGQNNGNNKFAAKKLPIHKHYTRASNNTQVMLKACRGTQNGLKLLRFLSGG